MIYYLAYKESNQIIVIMRNHNQITNYFFYKIACASQLYTTFF